VFNDAITGVGLVSWDAGILTANLNASAALNRNPDHIVHRNGLVHGEQFVKTIVSSWTNPQAKVNLRERPCRNHRGTEIVCWRSNDNNLL
jgi:hypothetical protein